MAYWTGCAVWGYKGWVGDFFPKKSQPEDFLKLYTERFTSVEGNTTFYAIPPASTVQKWNEQFPEGFHFCPKLFRGVTHDGLLTSHFESAGLFLTAMAPLQGKLGPILLQLPPSYGPENFLDLKRFLEWWPRSEFDVSVEVRHHGWWTPKASQALQDLLIERDMGRVLIDTRPIYECEDDLSVLSDRLKPHIPISFDRPVGRILIRFIGHPEPEDNAPYLREWSNHIKNWLDQGDDVYFFSHCPIEERSPELARTMHHMLEEKEANVGPLPWDHVVVEPEPQLSLF